MAVLQLTADDFALYRDIRLEALQADPDAFASTYEREVGFDEATWRSRMTTGPDGRPLAIFVDIDTGAASDTGATEPTTMGTAGILYGEFHSAPMLVAMWVRPEARGLGSGRRLVEAATDWARDRGDTEVVLWVVRDNSVAITLYEKCGFAPTGNVDVNPSNPCAEELEMVRKIDVV